MQISWDFRQMNWEPPGFRYYFLFLLLVWGITAVKTIKIWRALRRMERDREVDNFGLAHRTKLQLSLSDLLRWAVLTLLGWILFLSISVGDTCFELLNQAKSKIDITYILISLRGYAATLTIALITTIVLYLAQWSLWKKIETIEKEQPSDI